MSLEPPPLPSSSDDTRSPQLMGLTLSMTTLAFFFVAIRMYARLRVSRSVGWDDYTILAGMVLQLVNLILVIVQVHYGVGRHVYTLSIENLVRAGRYYHMIELLYIPGTAFIKISACLFLLRIMTRGTNQALRWTVYVLMAVIVILSVATTLTIIFRCIPVEGGWDPRIHAKCFSYSQILGIGYAQGAWSIVTDFACAGFPIIILRKLQINPKIKFALWGIMGLGILSSVCCVVKIVYLGDLAKGDFTYNGVDVIIWCGLEQNIGIVACSVPALQPLFKRWFDSRSTKGATPGARNNPVLLSWDDSTDLTYLSRLRSSHSTITDGTPRGEGLMNPFEERAIKSRGNLSDARSITPEGDGDGWEREPVQIKELHMI